MSVRWVRCRYRVDAIKCIDMKILSLFLFTLLLGKLHSQRVFLNVSATDSYALSVIETMAKGKKCYVFNLKERQPVSMRNELLRPLYVLKVFADTFQVGTASNETKMVSFDRAKDSALSYLYHDLYYNLTNYKKNGKAGSPYQYLYDGLIVKTTQKTYTFKGSILFQFFNVVDFEQLTTKQSSKTIINTNALMANFSFDNQWLADSIPVPDYANAKNRIEYDRINLIHKTNETYTYCRLMIPGFHDNSQRTEVFTYDPKVGIIGFKASYINSTDNRNLIDLGLQFSPDYFNFTFVRQIQL